MTRAHLRLLLLLISLLLPYAVRLPGGWDWTAQYLTLPPGAAMFLLGMNALVWAPLLALTWLYRDLRWLWLPALVGLGFLAWGHASLDLASDAQIGLAVAVLPVIALIPMLIAAVIAWWLDRQRTRKLRPNAG